MKDVVYDERETLISDAVKTGRLVNTHRWMPEKWVISQKAVRTVHEVVPVVLNSDVPPRDVVMRLEPFLNISNRNVEVFKLLDNALVTLHSLGNEQPCVRETPLNYTFIKKEFDHFATVAETNDEVLELLNELCVTLDACVRTDTQSDQRRFERKSIADPVLPRMRGHMTTSTSAKVDRTAALPRTKMVAACRQASSQTPTKPTTKRRKQHTCPICRCAGHHARTCKDVLLDENRERADVFFKRVIEDARVESYLSSVAARSSLKHANEVAARIQSCARRERLRLSLPNRFKDI